MEQLPPGEISDQQMSALMNAPGQTASTSGAQQPNPAGLPPGELSDGQMNAMEQHQQALQDTYGTTGQKIATGLEGAAEGLVGPVAPYVETHMMGISPESIKARHETNPLIHGTTEVGGFLTGDLLGVGEAAMLGKLGKSAAKLVPAAEKASVISRLAKGAAQTATELAAYQTGDEASKAILNGATGPGDVISHIDMNNVLKAAVLGGGAGPIFTGTGMLGKKVLDNTFLNDFAERLAFRKANVDPAEMIKHESENIINTYNSMANDLGGAEGLKAQAINHILPSTVSPRMESNAGKLLDSANNSLENLRNSGAPERLVSKLEKDIADLSGRVMAPEASPSQYFDAINDFKKTLQDYSKGDWGPFAIPTHHEAYDFLQATKSLSRDARLSLEDPGAWGKAATLQKDLNGAWKKAIPAASDFTKKFMTKIGDTYQISSDKFNTYLNQVNKATTTTDKQKLLGNFVESMDNYFKTVDGIYDSAGVKNPFQPAGMTALKGSLGIPSSGSKVADLWFEKLGASALGNTFGGAVGAKLGTLFGPTGTVAGAYLGKEALGPVFSSLVKPLMEKYPAYDLHAFRSAAAFANNIVKGDKLLKSHVSSIFSPTKMAPSLLISKRDLDELDNKAQTLNGKYHDMMEPGSKIADYMPAHAAGLTAAINSTVNLINSARPQEIPHLPLDKNHPITAIDKQKFYDHLTIAYQPLSVLSKIKDGTLRPTDVSMLKALHPDYYGKMVQEITNEFANDQEAAMKVPYKVKQSLSLFVGQPLVSSLTPASIQAAQPQPTRPNPPPGPKTKRGTSTLGKSNKQYMTPGQTAEADRGDRD